MQTNAANPRGGLCGNEWLSCEWCVRVENNGFSMYSEERQTLARQSDYCQKYLENLRVHFKSVWADYGKKI